MTEAAQKKTAAEVAADVDKAQAEAEKARADAAASAVEAEAKLLEAKANVAKAKAETAKINLEGDYAAMQLVTAKFTLDREVEKRNTELSADKYHYVYSFTEQVTDTSVKKCIATLNEYRRAIVQPEEKKLELVLYSPGGSVIAGMALYDLLTRMRREGWHITTRANGYAASMGGILLQAGDWRVCDAEAYILIHEIQSGAIGTMGEIEDEVIFLKKIQERIIDIFVSRSKGKISKRQFVANWRRKNWWLNSDEALKLGIVDEIG